MPKDMVQFNGDDGCVYILDLTRKCWKKLCPVDKLPPDVRKQVYEYLENAEDIISNAEALKGALL